MNKSFTVLPFEEDHIRQAAQIEKLCFSQPRSEEWLRRAYGQATFCAKAAVEEGRLAGYADMTFVAGEGYINNIAVLPEFRRQGIATALIEALLGEEPDFLTLEVREKNAAARALYEKLGFEAVGRIKNYYSEPSDDAILMTLFVKKGEDL